VNVHEGLEHPAGGGALGGLALLVGEGQRLLCQALSDAVFECGVNYQAQGHDGRGCNSRIRLFGNHQGKHRDG